jgi:hypothetical protein
MEALAINYTLYLMSQLRANELMIQSNSLEMIKILKDWVFKVIASAATI